MGENSEDLQIREMSTSDAAAVISLNHSVVSVTSPMDREKFNKLFGLSGSKLVATIDRECIGFVITLAHGLDYDNENYRCFSNQLEDFLYVDRIVVSGKSRGLGVGALLYSRAFELARHAGLGRVCAEIDIEPPNEPSLRFYKKIGFVQIGTRTLKSGKQVSMQACRLGESS